MAYGHQDWYKARSSVWGERYMKEKEDILTRERTKKEIKIIYLKVVGRFDRVLVDILDQQW